MAEYANLCYEKAFNPTKLCNWTISKGSVQPKKRNDVTKVIVNERGHLLPGLRKFAKNPWSGLFQGTYHNYKKTTKKQADEMANGDILSSWEKRSAHVPVIANPLPSPKAKSDSYDKENKKQEDPELICSKQPSESDHSQPNSASSKSSNILRDLKNHSEQEDLKSKKSQHTPILSDVYSNELVAKHLKLNNQKHHRLPDVVDNDSYAALQMKRETNPGLLLNTDPTSSAVGCKIFQSPGPTQCSKLKVFRPKTGPAREPIKSPEDRPKTTSRIKKRCKPLSEMDLAIYWDIPFVDEMRNYLNPAPAVFNVIPAEDYRKDITDAEVPSLIGSDNSSEKKHSKKQHTNPSAVMDVINADIKDKPPSPCMTEDSNKTEKRGSPQSSGSTQLSKRHFSSPSLNLQKSEDKSKHECIKSEKSAEDIPKLKSPSVNSWSHIQKRSKSSPNLSNVAVQVNKLQRPCIACELKCSGISGKSPKKEYKSAFKAGKLTNYKADERIIDRIQKSRNLKVPKPRIPFARKNYSIGTLAPPFSIWPKTGGQDYPDHWRLASIYQHSYKPPEMRKAPLIKTVFQ